MCLLTSDITLIACVLSSLVARSLLLLFPPGSLLCCLAAATAHLKHLWHVVGGPHPRSTHQSMLAGPLPKVCFEEGEWIWNGRQMWAVC